MTDLALFDLEQGTDDDDWCELRSDDSAFVSCRYCQTATTVRGIESRGHGPDSAECARMLAWEDRA